MKLLQPDGPYIYHQFNIQQFYVLTTLYIYVFFVDLRTNSDYFPIEHLLIGFDNRLWTICSLMVTKCTTSLTLNYSTFCPNSVFMCFVWISEQTDIISLYNINWLIFITETESVYCEVRTGSLSKTDAVLSLKGSIRFWEDNYSSTNNALLI